MTDDHEFNMQCMAISVAQGSYMYVYGFTRISVLACFYHLRSVLFTSVWFFIWSTFCLSQLFAASSSKLTVSTSRAFVARIFVKQPESFAAAISPQYI